MGLEVIQDESRQLIPFFAPTLCLVLQLHDKKSMSSEDAASLCAIDRCKAVEPSSYLLLDKGSRLIESIAIGGGRAR